MKMTKIILLLLVVIAGSAQAQAAQNGVGINSQTAQLANKGVVLDVLDSTMYTYLLVKGNSGKVWLAAYKSDIAKGDTVKYSNGVVMKDFQSKSLRRTFDKIIFVDTVVSVKKKTSPALTTAVRP